MRKNNNSSKKKTSQKSKKKTVTTRKSKDSMFTTLFGDPENTLRMYKELHPDDTDVTKDDIKIITLKNVFTKGRFNDLGFRVGKRFIVLVEAQSTFTVKIALRLLIYLAETYERYIREEKINVYSDSDGFGTDEKGKKIKLPAPELYVIYTGTSKVPDEIDFADLYDGDEKPLSLKVKIIKYSGEDTIVGQYIRFCSIFNEERRKFNGNTDKSIESVIARCKKENILVDFILIHETEVRRMLGDILGQEYADYIDNYEREQERRKMEQERRQLKQEQRKIKQEQRKIEQEQLKIKQEQHNMDQERDKIDQERDKMDKERDKIDQERQQLKKDIANVRNMGVEEEREKNIAAMRAHGISEELILQIMSTSANSK